MNLQRSIKEKIKIIGVLATRNNLKVKMPSNQLKEKLFYMFRWSDGEALLSDYDKDFKPQTFEDKWCRRPWVLQLPVK